MAPPQVLTAGGPTGTKGKKKNRGGGKNKNQKSQQQQQPDLLAAENVAAAAASTKTKPPTLEMEHSHNDEEGVEDISLSAGGGAAASSYSDDPATTTATTSSGKYSDSATSNYPASSSMDDKLSTDGGNGGADGSSSSGVTDTKSELLWLLACFFGIMASFVCYGLLLEYTTSGGRKLHELSFLFVTSGLYTLTAAAGRYVRDETPTTIPPARFAILGLTSMGSTFCSVRSLRYVIFPIQVLAKSCKPVPVMLFGAAMGKRYPLRKYLNVCLIVFGVALFMGGGESSKKKGADTSDMDSASQVMGILLLFISLCFDGGTGAYEDKLMSVHSVQPFDLMFNIQLGKTILAGIGLLVFNQLHIFLEMVQEMGFLLVALGLTGAMGQVFIFVTIAKFGALTCSIIGLARKVTTLVASIYFYGHHLSVMQFSGLVVSVTAMVMNFWGKKKGGGGGSGGGTSKNTDSTASHSDVASQAEELTKMLGDESEEEGGDVELAK